MSTFGAERLWRDYIGTDGKQATVEVDRDPEIVQTRLRQTGLTEGEVYAYNDGRYRLAEFKPGGASTLQEVCPGPYCHAPVTHRSLHDIPSGRFEDWSDEARARWAEVGL